MYNFGSPRVGNGNFSILFNRSVPNSFRIVVDGDIVTGIPPKTSFYKHVETTVVVDGKGSGSLIIDPSFVERRLQFSSRNSVTAHYLSYYRAGLQSAIKASVEIREYARLKNHQHNPTRNVFLFPTSTASRRFENTCGADIDANRPSKDAIEVSERTNEGLDADKLDVETEFNKHMDNILSTDATISHSSLFESFMSLLRIRTGIIDVAATRHDAPLGGSVDDCEPSIKMSSVGNDV